MTVAEAAPETAEFLLGLYDDMPEGDYHRDPVPGGSLSASGAKKLLPPSCPAMFAYERQFPVVPSKAMNLGSAAHKLVLGRGAELVLVDADNYQTKAARETRDDALAVGKVPLLEAEYGEVRAMAAALRDHPVASALFDPERGGRAEVSLFWEDPATGITRRGRLDWLPPTGTGRIIIGDYKTAISANPDSIVKAVANFGYHQQHPWYVDGVRAIFPGAEVRFVFVFQEKTPPYLVSVVELDHEAVLVGDDLNRQAIDKYVACTETGVWPGYVPDTQVLKISLPAWARPRW